MSSSTSVLVEVTSVWGLDTTSYVKLPDSAYGELLIYQANKPVFYLSIFDEIYKDILPKFEQSSLSLTSLAQKSFALNKLPYTTTQTLFGFKGNSASEVITLEKYPVRYLLSVF